MKKKKELRKDLLSGIVLFEEGRLDDDQIIELFQYLIDTGVAWQLQGGYGRFASDLIKRGHCMPSSKEVFYE